MFKLSVIIPVYNAADYIKRCAESLFKQTLDCFEILFVDDCSSDGSAAIINDILEKYPNRKKQTKIIKTPVNSGACVSRFYGLDFASGEYIVFCDSDDFFSFDALKKIFNEVCSSEADIVVYDYFLHSAQNVEEQKLKLKGNGNYFEGLLRGRVNTTLWNKVFRRHMFNFISFMPKGDMGEDFIMLLQLFFKSRKNVYLEEPLYHYCINENSISHKKTESGILERFNQSIANAEVFINFMRENDLEKKYSREINRVLFYKKTLLYPLVSNPKFYQLWKNTFSEINHSLLFNPLIPFKEKVKYILVFVKLYRKGF